MDTSESETTPLSEDGMDSQMPMEFDSDNNDDDQETPLSLKTPQDEEEDEERQERQRLAEQEIARYTRIKEKQSVLLNAIRVQEKGDDNNAPFLSPIESLAQQAEVYSSFMGISFDAINGIKGCIKGTGETGNKRCRQTSNDIDSPSIYDDSIQSVTRLTKQPKCIVGGTMRSYQLEGLNWLISLYNSGINGILADEMGLGKTLQTISLLGYLYERLAIHGPHLVIVPKSTVSNWRREFSSWCPSLHVVILQGDHQERSSLIETHIKPLCFHVCITSYEIVMRERSALSHIAWSYLIIDEAHRIKNEKSSLSTIVRQLNTCYRLLITGTPLQNNLHELWSLLNFLMPIVFHSAVVFDNYFTSKDQSDVIRKMHTILRPFLLRRLKSEVETDLPPKKETKLYIGLTDMQLFWYKNVLKKDIEALNSIGGASRLQLQNILMQLRKVCNHPYLFPGAEPGPPYLDGSHLWMNSGKMLVLDKLLKRMKEQGSRVLIFCQMTRMLDILEDFLNLREYEYCRIDGQTSSEDREKSMDLFNHPLSSRFCFLLSTRAGGLGINLATADIVVLYDSDWNPQADLQAQDRAHRIGQKKPVRVYRLITERTVEEKIIERAEKKLLLDAVVIQQGRGGTSERDVSVRDMAKIVTYGADFIFSTEKGTYTTNHMKDDDIDKVLLIGEQRSERNLTNSSSPLPSLSSFSLSSKQEFDIYQFHGEDYRNQSLPTTYIALPSRTKKKTIDGVSINSLGRSQMICPYHDYQLIDVVRLMPILEKEARIDKIRMMMNRKIRELKLKIDKGNDQVMEQYQTMNQEYDQLSLSPQDQQIKESILSDGFPLWSRSDYRSFIQSCETYGRNDTINIIQTVSRTAGKSKTEVKRYYDAFCEKACNIQGLKRGLQRIEKAEQKLARKVEIEKCISMRINDLLDPFSSVNLGIANQKASIFSDFHDGFLLCCLSQLGYGNWDLIRQEVQRCTQFRFDWHFRTRTAGELQKRCDAIIRLIEKEQNVVGRRTKKRKARDADEDDSEVVKDELKKTTTKRRKRNPKV